MKKILTTILLMFAGIILYAQGLTTYISGTVTDATTGAPISGQAVYIYSDSTASSFSYYNVVYTNPNGYYCDTLTIPYPSQIIFTISTSNCNGAMVTGTVVSSTTPMTYDFSLNCGGTPATCSAYFYAYPDSANTMGYTYYFYDQSSAGSAVITSWAWDFGDGSTEATQYPSHTFAYPGYYDVCLTITSDSCTDTYCENIYIDSNNTNPCYASFQFNISSGMVDFYGYSNNSLADFTWDFGDGFTGTGQNISHDYTTAGPFNVCLTINDNNGCYDQVCQTITINNGGNGCPASFYAYPDSSNGSMTYYFYNTSPGANTNVQFYWSFGDGATSSAINPTHSYTSAGVYAVCLYVLDDSTGVILCSYCDSVLADTANSYGCYAYFGWSSANSANSVYFYDYSGTNNTSDMITSWTWNFGDGTSSTEQNPVHSLGSGLYYVCLAITTASGCSSTYCDYVQVNYIDSNYCNLYVQANAIQNESYAGAADGAIDIDVYGGVPPFTYSWSNGATTEDISGLTAGYYDLIVTDNSGLQGCQTWATFEILNQADSSNWVYIDTVWTNPLDTCFNFSIGSAYIYSWEFVNNTSVEITWIVYDTQGVNHGYVTVVYSYTTAGAYQFAVTIICGSYKGSLTFYDGIYIMTTSAINEMNNLTDNITVYPNPVADQMTIAITELTGETEINVFNAMGQLIQTEKTMIADLQNGLTINTSSLPEGFYTIQLTNKTRKFTGRFIK